MMIKVFLGNADKIIVGSVSALKRTFTKINSVKNPKKDTYEKR
jgi:hypothetical protein